MTAKNRHELMFSRRNHARQMGAGWRKLLEPETLLTNFIRLGFFLLVLGVLFGAWVVANAHLTEQFMGAPHVAAGLIDPQAGQGALTPDNIERQILAFSLRMRSDELAKPAGADPRPRPFVVNQGDAARTIAANLAAQGFVRDADLFNLYMRVHGLERQIEAGNFMLAETMTIPQVAQALQSARFEEAVVTIPEGFRAEEIAERLAENNVIEADRFLTAVRQPRTLSVFNNYDFLKDLPADASLEGFLFPDTYRLPVLATQPDLVLKVFLDNFEAKVAKNGLVGGGSGLSGRDLITLASIVEREAVQADERPIIASVYINRLNGTCAKEVGGNYLQADPTVQYRAEPWATGGGNHKISANTPAYLARTTPIYTPDCRLDPSTAPVSAPSRQPATRPPRIIVSLLLPVKMAGTCLRAR